MLGADLIELRTGRRLGTAQLGQVCIDVAQGDPRRSTIFWVNQMQMSGPLGYGPPLFDPQTGETISGARVIRILDYQVELEYQGRRFAISL